MSYQLEQLGDERFQQLCQALLVCVFPNVQCLPVGQPDGGRDAFARALVSQGKSSELAIFQVKYVKSPSERESRELIEGVVKTERAKVKRLISKGATSYHLMTNVSGTSHLDRGSVDKVEAVLTDEFGIPAYCWWRDDINRRIDSNSSIKWSYPEIIRATDLLESLLENIKDPDMKRRGDVIRSYMAHQAKIDSQLKFKQVDLQKNLAEMFVDVPSRVIPKVGVDEQKHENAWLQFFNDNGIDLLDSVDDRVEADAESVGALELMVSNEFAMNSPRLVVEGAPGQGKSTITQYLCQVHRLRLLNRHVELAKVDHKHRPSAARVPFRVDLRDYASWIAGRNPFSDELNAPLPQSATPLLESFIAEQVHRQTGANFSVDDLTAVSCASQVLVVLDGFDEVADIKTRNRIVEEVSSASERMSANAISIQIIVTSRPAVFANSPGFSRRDWQYLEILPLVRSVIDQYADKWMKGRGIDKREQQVVTAVLNEKLLLPHVRDLARNPMQLAILLTLINVQGSSLPNKRTELYDNYVDIFLNRESEKSAIVRDHRALLVNIHRYLAWHLQSEAEGSGGAGNIAEGKLKDLLRAYLHNGGHDPELVNRLFTGMVERVVALVSRVQGTFEFEVQPLREYFAARHLYDTARYAPGSRYTKGTKPDRFDALLRNFYWLNVTRFYAGCYTSGELASLIDGFEEVMESKSFRNIGYTAQLGASLLNDHVFSLNPKLARRLAEKIVGSPSFGVRISEISNARSSEGLVMPKNSGQEALVRYALAEIGKAPHYDRVMELSKVLRDNLGSSCVAAWYEVEGQLDSRGWIAFGKSMGVFSHLDKNAITELLKVHGSKLGYLYISRTRPDVCLGSSEFWDNCLNELVLEDRRGFPHMHEDAEINPSRFLPMLLSTLMWPYILTQPSAAHKNMPISATISAYIYGMTVQVYEANLESLRDFSKIDGVYKGVAQCCMDVTAQSWSDFSSQKSEFPNLIEECRKVWGDQWMLYSAAINFACASDVKSDGSVDIFDESKSISSRANYAVKQKDVSWWRAQVLRSIGLSDNSRRFVITAAYGALDVYSFISIGKALCDAIAGIEDRGWPWSLLEMQSYGSKKKSKGSITFEDAFSVDCINPEIAVIALSAVEKERERDKIWKMCLKEYDGKNRFVWWELASYRVRRAVHRHALWRDTLPLVKSAYQHGAIVDIPRISKDKPSSEIMPTDVAEKICAEYRDYPAAFVAAASAVISKSVGAQAVGLGQIALESEWFEE